MNQQQLDFLKMAKEFYEDESTLQIYLKYCPDSLIHLFDLSVMKPCAEQVQISSKLMLHMLFYSSL